MSSLLLLLLLACAAPAAAVPAKEMQAAQPYNNTLALHLLRLAGAAYCPSRLRRAGTAGG